MGTRIELMVQEETHSSRQFWGKAINIISLTESIRGIYNII